MISRELNASSGRNGKDLINRPPFPATQYNSCSLHSQHLRDIYGIEKFRNLERINLSCNSIQSIEPVVNLRNLRVLIASYNQVSFNFYISV